MFIKRLAVSSVDGMLRDIEFGPGLNLIVDDTPESAQSTATGNNVGKTTVLRLIDYCLGAEAKPIYADPENPRNVYQLVKDYLRVKHVLIHLELVADLSSANPETLTVERNFLQGKQCIRTINGTQTPAKEFLNLLSEELFPSLPIGEKPTFRQVIGHNIRIDDWALSHTLAFLRQNTAGVEYEPLYLFMLGCTEKDAAEKQRLALKKKEEFAFAKKVSPGRDEGFYETAIDVLDNEIAALEDKRSHLAVAENYADLLTESDSLAIRIARLRSELSRVEIRIGLIHDAERSIEDARSTVDVEQLRFLYDEASALVPSIQKSFEQLVAFHNGMLEERAKFIKRDLPELGQRQKGLRQDLDALLEQDKKVSGELSSKISSKEAEDLLVEINGKYQQKGELEGLLKQLRESHARLEDIDERIAEIDRQGEEAGQDEKIRQRLSVLNRAFGLVSQTLYGETYFVRPEHKTDKSGVPYFSLRVDATNISSGKKQGEALCFDIAYTRFADEEGIDCLHFVLNDKKELVHGNQLRKIDEVARDNNVQVIISMLRDKLPDELVQNPDFVVLSLSQEDKFFKIEGHPSVKSS
ncbi:DUF2326 domain-containing protein [Olsenella sp. Marseille-P4559]|uniref:DUF2326 domain-containing protein n=1 Tax=Olsenella sp. Marseille-P4559 TaxID=2364795 RepID=UPI00103261CE|nr:DUF2326 domain-containing protein [Olsenella sp. Marseille-P4559]